MARIMMLVIVSALLCLSSDSKVDACSCQPAHPQYMYCRSGFVIKALVGKARMVELGENGKYKRIHKGKTTGDEGSTESSGYSEKPGQGIAGPDVDILNDDGDIRPAPVILSTGFTPLKISAMVGPIWARGIVPALRRKRRESHVNKKKHGKRNALRPRKHRARGLYQVGAPPGSPPVQATPEKTLMLQYRISIVKTFKGLENVTKAQRAYMYTPPHPLCSMKLTTNKSPFILMGNMQNGVMVIRECDYKVDLTEITDKEGKNLVRNMRYRFESGCENCHVKVCNRGGCGPGSVRQPHQCQWLQWWTVYSPGASQFACLQTKAGKCKWYNGANKYAKPGDLSSSYSVR